MNEDTRPLMVTIQCFTYNHEPYIRQCLEGFVMQKTNFRFEAIVHDDASTDGTAAIIKEYAEKYPDIIKPIFETENQYSKHDGSLSRIMDEHTHGKYIAICEGDDYWIDSLKLQKQVDFLEHNPDYGLCFTNFICYNTTTSQYIKRKQNHLEDDKYEQGLIERGNIIGTLTVCYRNELYKRLPKNWSDKKWFMGDLPLWIEMAHEMKVKYIKDITAVYRVLANSASHSSNDIKKISSFYDSAYDIKSFYNSLYGNKYKPYVPHLAKMKLAFQFKDRILADKIIKKCNIRSVDGIKILILYLATISPIFCRIFKIVTSER